MNTQANATLSTQVVADTVAWLERAVIGLNLCPFAKAVHVHQQIHYAVTLSHDPADVLTLLKVELQALAAMSPQVRDTTLLMAPRALSDFLMFNDFLTEADDLLCALELDGEIQIASFHPDYQFAGTQADEVSNCTNRSPYPTLHLIREASIDRAVQAFPQADEIFERNIATLEAMGPAGWRALDVGPHVTSEALAALDAQAHEGVTHG